MPEPWKTVRVFISSTFRDMHAERDYLVRFVFPELRERCAGRRLHLVEVDLRWGVTEEEAERRAVLAVCLDEIDRCRPFFIGLLGERFGWAPPRYEAPDEPRYDWLRGLPSGYSITALEIYYGVLRNPELADRAFFYFRDPAFMAQVPPEARAAFEPESAEAAARMQQLKEQIRRGGWPVMEDYPCTYGGLDEQGRAVLTGLEALGRQVLADLWSAIERAYPLEEAPPAEPAEGAYHEAFIEEACRHFVGRQDLLAQMEAYAGGGEEGPLVLTGPGGSGKSALLARFARAYAAAHPDVFVLPHFAGIGPASSDLRLILARLCRALKACFDLQYYGIPDLYGDLLQTFWRFLREASSRGKVLLLLDGLDQLDVTHNAHRMDWLPTPPPQGLRVIASAADGDCLDALRYRWPSYRELAVGPLRPDEQRELVRQTLWDYRKRLDERPSCDQLGLLLSRADAGNPLYLSVACEELRLFGEFERVTERIAALPAGTAGLLEQVLARVERDHGPELVQGALTALASARHGLLESELLELLSPAPGSPLPAVLWARLYRSLRFYLRQPGETGEDVLDFFHGRLREAVTGRYLSSRAAREQGHRRLAAYLAAKGYRHERTLAELAYHLGQGRLWPELEALLGDLAFLEATARRLGASAGSTGGRIDIFLQECLAPIPPEVIAASPRLAHLSAGAAPLAAALELYSVRACGAPDEQARCRLCGRPGIIHGAADLGGVDNYDNYYAWCPHCFWAWHDEAFSSWGSEPGVRIFDYASNIYVEA